MKLSRIYESSKDNDIDISNLEYKDYFTIRLKAQGSMKDMTATQRSDLFKSIGKEWKVLKSKDKTKMKENTGSILNMNELNFRKTIRNIVRTEMHSVLTEWDVSDDNDDFEPSDVYYEDTSDIILHVVEESRKIFRDMFKEFDKYNAEYLWDHMINGLFDGYDDVEDLFKLNNNKLIAYFNKHAKNIPTNKFNDRIYVLSDEQDGSGGILADRYADPTLYIDLDIVKWIKSGYLISNLIVSDIEECYNHKTNESFAVNNTDESSHYRMEALMEDIREWFVEHEKNIIDLVEDYVF